MSLITEVGKPRSGESLHPRTKVWDDGEYQTENGYNLAEIFKLSLLVGIPLYYSPILPAKKVTNTLTANRSLLSPDEYNMFNVGFASGLGLEKVTDLVDKEYGDIDFLYLSGGTIVFEPIRRFDDYLLPKEDGAMRDGVILPAVRVCFVASDI